MTFIDEMHDLEMSECETLQQSCIAKLLFLQDKIIKGKNKKIYMINKRLIIASVFGVVLTVSCGNRDTQQHDGIHDAGEHPAASSSQHAHAGEVVMHAEQAAAAGVVAEIVNPAPFHAVIPTSGTIQAAPGDEMTVVATMSGVVQMTRPLTVGTQVGAGTTLFRISARDIQDGDPGDRVSVTYDNARREYERAKKLRDDRIVSEKEFNAIRENYELARIAYQALIKGKRSGSAGVHAAKGGYVSGCMVKDGDYVEAGQPLLTLVLGQRLCLVADVPGRYQSLLGDVRSARFKSSYGGKVYDMEHLNGRLTALARTMDVLSSYVPVTFEFDACDGLMSGMPVEVYLIVGEREQVISLPLGAVTEELGAKFVYIKKDATCYAKTEVETGSSDGERVEIVSGLKGGENVVTRGAIHLKLASASNAIPAHTHSH